MTIKTSTLRPGFLISLKTSVRGNVSYDKAVIESETVVDGTATSKWETARTIVDKSEHEAAIKVRSKCRQLVTSICTASKFGLTCPDNAADVLEYGMKEARRLADEFNATSLLSKISVYIIAGKIAPDDAEAVRAINSEVADLMADMQEGIKALDFAAVRDAATSAKGIAQMLTPDAAARVQMAIETARRAAKEIKAAGDAAKSLTYRREIGLIAEQRTAFLDLDEAPPVAAPKAAQRALDLGGAPAAIKAASPPSSPMGA